MKNSNRKLMILLISFVVGLLAPLIAAGQGSSLTGKYEGTAKGPNGELALQLELVDEAGKISGQVTSPHGSYKITKAQLADGVLTLEAEGSGSKGKMTLRQKDDKLSGEFTADGATGPVEFHKVTSVDISGEWNAVADAQGQPFPFTLVLKVDGEKVTGSSSSQMGNSPISSGTWKDGKLAIILESGNGGQVILNAVLANGQLTGNYDFAGQASGNWAAVKNKP